MNTKLLVYLELEILPLYDYLDDAHNRKHIENVVDFAMKLSKNFPDVNPETVITAAVYHDLGNLKSRDNHHIISAQLVLDDKNLENWLTEEEICDVATACLEHRHTGFKPSTLLSKIIADADRSDSTDLTRAIQRCYFYTKQKYLNEKTHDEISDEVYDYVYSKFGINGSLKSFNLPETDEILNESLEFNKIILRDKKEFLLVLDNLILGKNID